MEKQIFIFDSYKKVMAHLLTGKDRRGQLTRAADFLRCQRSYLSRVIVEELHLTPDHAFQLAKFWKFNLQERNYFMKLVELERSGDHDYRVFLKQQLLDLKAQHENIQERIKKAHLSPSALQISYFSSWTMSAVHFLTAIDEYHSVEAIASRLNLRKTQVLECLHQLKELGYVSMDGNRWKYQNGDFHAPKNSPLVILHHQNWRQRSILDAQDFENNNVHFTGVLTLSRADVERLKELFLNFISEANQISAPSNPEEAVALTCDLFKI